MRSRSTLLHPLHSSAHQGHKHCYWQWKGFPPPASTSTMHAYLKSPSPKPFTSNAARTRQTCQGQLPQRAGRQHRRRCSVRRTTLASPLLQQPLLLPVPGYMDAGREGPVSIATLVTPSQLHVGQQPAYHFLNARLRSKFFLYFSWQQAHEEEMAISSSAATVASSCMQTQVVHACGQGGAEWQACNAVTAAAVFVTPSLYCSYCRATPIIKWGTNT